MLQSHQVNILKIPKRTNTCIDDVAPKPFHTEKSTVRASAREIIIQKAERTEKNRISNLNEVEEEYSLRSHFPDKMNVLALIK